ncbi:hypothetical protein GM3709_337 [Geminocystis sp. NIES-3709]|nr:hypothetical protein GM3709_337 [Geminocystis sp. NIES-3709]
MYNSDDLQILDEMINDNSKLNLITNNKKKEVILKEIDGHEYSVTIKNIPEETIVIKSDCFESPESIFKNTKRECKRCDFIIISYEENRKFIIFIEMKSGKGDNKEIIQQLKGGKCLVKYFQIIGKEFWQNLNFLDNYNYRFVSFAKILVPMRSNKRKKDKNIHDSPENMLKISSPKTIVFSKLIGQLS